MLYIQDHNYTQRIMIPKSFSKRSEDLVLRLVSTMDKRAQDIKVVDTKENPLYYFFDIQLEEGSPKGEYNYQVIDRGVVIAEGIAIVRTTENADKSFEEKIEYKQYDGE